MSKEPPPTIVAADPDRSAQPGSIMRVLPESWRLEFRSIDSEHQTLIDDLNIGWSAFGATDAIPFDRFAPRLASLKRDMQRHFASEEGEMAALNYPGLKEHKAQHAAVMEKLGKIEAEAAASGNVNRETIYALLDALVDDVLRADIPFKTFLFDRGLVE